MIKPKAQPMLKLAQVSALASCLADCIFFSFDSCRALCLYIITVRPEKIINPYGSTAGAGSGEFHTYRHARAREMDRLKTLDEQDAERQAEEEFQRVLEQNKALAEERTNKRRKRRLKQKEAKKRKQNLEKLGIDTDGGGDIGDAIDDDKSSDDEFEYTPMQNTSKDNMFPSKEGDTKETKQSDVRDEKVASEETSNEIKST
jgi:hypothetical protein